jgi:hypothetical protein
VRGTLAALAVVGALLLAPGAAFAARASVGISDQEPATYADPLLSWVGITHARVIVPWDVALAGPSRIDSVLSAAHADGQDILVSFEHSSSEACAGGPCQLPTPAEYRRGIAAFHQRFPYVTAISPWNEANHPSQPTAANPEAAAQYYLIARDVCPECRVMGAEVVDLANMGAWLHRFKAALPTVPRLWGLHNYGDVTRRRSVMTRRLLRMVPGVIWLTETGGLVHFQLRDGVTPWRYDEARAARSVAYTFALADAHPRRITRVYLYNWRSVPWLRWDSGLLSRAGVPRPSFCVVAARLRPAAKFQARRCPPRLRAHVVHRPRYRRKTGRVRATVSCPAAHVSRCTVVMVVRTKGPRKRRHGRTRRHGAHRGVLAERTVRVRAGHKRLLRVRVPRARRRLIRSGKTHVLRAQMWLGDSRPRQFDVRCRRAHRR